MNFAERDYIKGKEIHPGLEIRSIVDSLTQHIPEKQHVELPRRKALIGGVTDAAHSPNSPLVCLERSNNLILVVHES